ncbi:TetR/AcrR family transcriptional regulator; helix-turn-helix transcriptional regulator [Paraburkholderia sp. MMS20-SJTR3]|uniref:TetR/AcrR family transcriptional regulator helix-turn-helix transcriptional regulator n=1 Tax=Paraburkholderia sejongensis TaxID=2886946 RepID=A0ABS8JMH2_9BURK|nr:TetR/AcrR family transcriptional regulator [Paraburkholderia sp. MMS20-SJTR3]MCC8391105.1 TetR/AcrR family transcriptional regulator; helix-turn-helix transcriptional regulator [Paraburkholderia sp. MMS20-SJTR3]
MSNVRSPRASRRQAVRGSGERREATAERSPRLARRRRETRVRLLDAAFALIVKKGMEGVTINAITNAADVGFGSFYNHFDSKEGLLTALVDWLFAQFVETLDGLVGGLSDPAEVVAVSVRHTLLRACYEPAWGHLLIREGLSARALSSRLGQRLLRDARRGIAQSRFVVSDELISVLSVIGTVLAGLAVELHFPASSKTIGRSRKVLRSRQERFAQNIAAVVLQALGLKRVEAEKVARRPMPAGDASVR